MGFTGLGSPRRWSPRWPRPGDMVGGLLNEGNAGPAENADTWTDNDTL